MSDEQEDIYSPTFVKGLFDEMSGTYGVVNVLSSFGFCILWRKQCLNLVNWRNGPSHVLDLMSGMGELWPDIQRRTSGSTALQAIDLSPVMCQHSLALISQKRWTNVVVHSMDALENNLPDGCADVIVSSFGVKTFSASQQRILAEQTARLLRPNGQFAFLEISVPPGRLLRSLFMFYLNHCIPVVGKLMLGNPDNYRMLGVYTQAFGSIETFALHLRDAGLKVEQKGHFFGCATSVSGQKPQS